MPLLIVETADSPVINQSTTEPNAEFKYKVSRTVNEWTVRAAFEGSTLAPAVYDGLRLQGISYTHTGAGIWEVSVKYGIFLSKQLGKLSVEFDTGGGKARIKQSKESIASYPAVVPPYLPAPDFKGAIGVDKDKVEGVDKVIPNPRFSVTGQLSNSLFNSYAYFDTVCELTGTVNDAYFYGRQRGEVLLLGVKGSQRTEDIWEITLSFEVALNVTDLVVCTSTAIEGREIKITKEGHHYFWVRYEADIDTEAKTTIQKARFGYVERIYDYKSFLDLGIGF